MRKILFAFCIFLGVLFGVVISGCTAGGGAGPSESGGDLSPKAATEARPVATLQLTPTQTAPRVTVVTGPVTSVWLMAERPVITSGIFTFAVHVVFLSKDWTTILYSLSGPAAGGPLPLASVSVRDDQARDYSANQSLALANLDGLQLGVIIFQPRRSGANEMHLRVRPAPDANALDAIFARKLGPPSEDHLLARSAFFRDGYLQQVGYRISFNSWTMQRGDRIAQTLSEKGKTLQEILSESATKAASNPARPEGTPTIVQPDPTAGQLAGGKQILDEATLRIENLQSHLVNYLFAVLLEDGEVRGALLQ